MRVSIIGKGNVGTHLAARAQEMGHEVSLLSARGLAEVPASDLIILCVKDDVIADVAARLPLDAVVAHTSGSTSIDVLPQERRAVLYPLQTFTKTTPVDWTQVPLFTEGDERVADFARSLNTRSVQLLDTPNRLRLHMAAVFACNFANHCMALGAEQMQQAGLDWTLLLPLIDATMAKAHRMHPREGQTGPAVRNDQRVITLHESVLPEPLRQLYHLLTLSIQTRS